MITLTKNLPLKIVELDKHELAPGITLVSVMTPGWPWRVQDGAGRRTYIYLEQQLWIDDKRYSLSLISDD